MVTIFFRKTFTSGSLVGLSVPAKIDFPDMGTAKSYIDWLNQHKKVSVRALGGSDYICSDIYISNNSTCIDRMYDFSVNGEAVWQDET